MPTNATLPVFSGRNLLRIGRDKLLHKKKVSCIWTSQRNIIYPNMGYTSYTVGKHAKTPHNILKPGFSLQFPLVSPCFTGCSAEAWPSGWSAWWKIGAAGSKIAQHLAAVTAAAAADRWAPFGMMAMDKNWLVVWNIWIIFPYDWEFHHPNWLSHFSEG